MIKKLKTRTVEEGTTNGGNIIEYKIIQTVC